MLDKFFGWGVKQKVENTPQGKPLISRRNFIATAGTAAVVGIAGEAVWNNGGLDDKNEVTAETEIIETTPEVTAKQESIATQEQSESFEKEKAGWEQWWTLDYKEVFFVDDSGTMIGTVAPFETFIVDRARSGRDGKSEVFKYSLSPGELDSNGMLAGNIAPEWTRFVKVALAHDNNVAPESLHQKHITEDFEKAVQIKSEPELRSRIISAVNGEPGIGNMLDLVHYFGMNPEKPVPGDYQGRTYSEYLNQEIAFSDNVPHVIQKGLIDLVSAQVAKESRFRDDMKKNSQTAWGAAQLIDSVRVEYLFTKDLASTNPDKKKRKEEDKATKKRLADTPLSFMQQVDVMGKHYSAIYGQVQHWMKNELVRNEEGKLIEQDRPETYKKLRGLFPETPEGDIQWQKFFLLPCMVNAYNAGAWTIGACLHEFAAAHSVEELLTLRGENPGYDLFQAFTRFAKECSANEFTEQYGPDAQSYYVSIVAEKSAEEKYKKDQSTRVASN
jgi:hypothetical protein